MSSGRLGAVGAQVGVAGGVQVGHEAEVFGVEAGFQRAARAGGRQGAQHGLHAAPAAPFVYLHLERCADHTVGVHERLDVGAVEHDAGHAVAAVGKHAREVVLLRAHGTAVRQRHVACQEAGHGVLLPERCQRVQLLHVFQRELVQVDARVDLDERVEGVFGQGVHVGAQTLGERRQVLCGQGDAHGGVMAAEPRGQVGHGLDGLEEVDLPHASPRPARLVALDGEQQGRHAVRVHQAACHDALHAFVPAFARHHQCALPVVDLGGLGLGDLGQLGLDGAALVVHGLQPFGQMRTRRCTCRS